jgi:hypothetical protein
VIVKHVVRNALIPVVTLVALQMPAVFGGAIVTEQIFRIPRIGSLLISSILANDTPVIMAVTFVFACLVILFNLIADILYVAGSILASPTASEDVLRGEIGAGFPEGVCDRCQWGRPQEQFSWLNQFKSVAQQHLVLQCPLAEQSLHLAYLVLHRPDTRRRALPLRRPRPPRARLRHTDVAN